MAGQSPTSRTLKIFREKGFECQIVERFIMGARIRKDYLSCIDIHAIREGKKTIVGIQAFSTAWTAHQRKILIEFPEGARFWLSMRHKLVFVGWRKLKLNRGGRALRWTPRFGVVKMSKKKHKLKLLEVDTETFWRMLL